MLESFYFLVLQFVNSNSATFIHVPYFNNLFQLLQLHIRTTKVVMVMKKMSVDFANCCIGGSWRYLNHYCYFAIAVYFEVFGLPGGNDVGYNSLWLSD